MQGAECSGPRAVAGKLAKQQRKALVLQQVNTCETKCSHASYNATSSPAVICVVLTLLRHRLARMVLHQRTIQLDS
jgi:hypothetical protein